MRRYDVIIVEPTGQHAPIYQDIPDKQEAIEKAEDWYIENVKGRYEGTVEVIESIEQVVKIFEENNPDDHEAKEKDVDFEDFFA